jgi:phosphoglycerol transferase MdoB-like AlkP superfamily enzyme
VDVPNKTLAANSYVPLLFFGKPVEDAHLAGRRLEVATHLDISATIMELVAPEGTVYHTWGRNLLESPKSPRPEMNQYVIYKDGQLHAREDGGTPHDYKRLINIYQGLSRWRLFNGKDLP